MPLHHAHIISEPGRNSVNVDSFARTDRSEGMPHHVWRDPGNSQRIHVVGESPSKIESVAMTALHDIRLQNIRRTQAPAFQKVRKLICQRYGSRIAVLRPKACRRANLDCASRKIEPFGYRFHDLQLSHSGVKTAEQHVAQIVCRSIFDESLGQFEICKARSGFSINPVKLNIENGITPA